MKVYHGTNVRFERIDLSKCNPDNDFGRGFYVTAIKQHALQRAQNMADRYGGDPLLMEFEFDEKFLSDENYRTLVFKTPSQEWVEFVIQNRNRTLSKPVHDFDIVAGPIADDKMRRQFDRYAMKEITMEQLLEKVTYREPTHQIMLGSVIALNLIQPNEDFLFSKIEDFITSISIALVRDFNMDMLDAMNIVYNSDTFLKLMDLNTGFYHRTWQEIYEILQRELNRIS
ncbi:MAG: DUF3990 domain-containing protein [Tannerella sp.]|jgi:hypothetical protein|nr:DUF3990 domain-containing protein [Tannerella sp.]